MHVENQVKRSVFDNYQIRPVPLNYLINIAIMEKATNPKLLIRTLYLKKKVLFVLCITYRVSFTVCNLPFSRS